MKTKTALLALGLCLGMGSALAAGDPPQGSQQNKMKTCNVDAKEKSLKGDARKTFMRECLSAAGPATDAAPPTQQNKMKTCNADAKVKALKGTERKSFMRECLSSK